MYLKRHKDFIKESNISLIKYFGDFKVKPYMMIDGKFIKDKIPDIVYGDFLCYNCELTSLEGGPIEVEKNYICQSNQLTSLEGGPKKVGSFFCQFNQLTSLEGGPKEVEGLYDCTYNNLTTLKGSPNIIKDTFNCSENKLISLEYCPKIIGGNISSSLKIEDNFINNGCYVNNYWQDLLKYMIKFEIDFGRVKGWPKGFITKETIKSTKGITKFNL